MSKTIRNKRTRGFLAKLQKARKTRKEIRDMKADDLYRFDFLFETQLPAQEA